MTLYRIDVRIGTKWMPALKLTHPLPEDAVDKAVKKCDAAHRNLALRVVPVRSLSSTPAQKPRR